MKQQLKQEKLVLTIRQIYVHYSESRKNAFYRVLIIWGFSKYIYVGIQRDVYKMEEEEKFSAIIK
jgi:hypothetical protein